MCANSQSRHHTAVKQAPRQHERQAKNRLQRRLAWLQLVMQVIAHSREHSAFIDAFEGDQRIVPHHLVAVIQ